jgi:hypothetical protein
LTNLKTLNVRHSKQMDLDLTTLSRFELGRLQPAHVAASGNRPADTARVALRAKFELDGRDLTNSMLQVSNNQLKWLPAELGQLPKLEGLVVRRWVGSL